MTAMENKVAVITGGARGVGFGIAQEIIAEGGTAVIIGSTPSTKAKYGMSQYGGSKAAICQSARWGSGALHLCPRLNPAQQQPLRCPP